MYGLSTNPYPVHRLDKVRQNEKTRVLRQSWTQNIYFWQGTTGVLVLARTKALARELSRQFRTHAVEKTYLALVRGDAGSFPAKEGLIAGQLSFDDGRVRVVQATASGESGGGTQAEPGAGGKAAQTAWEVLASSVSQSMRRVLQGGSPQSLNIHALHLCACYRTSRRFR